MFAYTLRTEEDHYGIKKNDSFYDFSLRKFLCIIGVSLPHSHSFFHSFSFVKHLRMECWHLWEWTWSDWGREKKKREKGGPESQEIPFFSLINKVNSKCEFCWLFTWLRSDPTQTRDEPDYWLQFIAIEIFFIPVSFDLG